MNKVDLMEVLRKHELWIDNNSAGERANLSGANLSGADLSRANLSRANLYEADLSRANLSRANLYEADLYEANLFGSNLSGANLSEANLFQANLSQANLSEANLFGADLFGARGNGSSVKSAHLTRYDIVYTDSILQIGCENHTIEEWSNFNDDEISKMDSDALEWWREWKEIIFKLIEKSPANPTGCKKEK